MTSFALLSEFTRSLFSLWAFVLCLLCIFSTVFSVNQKRYRFAVLSLLPFLCGYFLWQVIFDLHLSGRNVKAAEVSRKAGDLPWLLFALSLFVITLAASSIMISVIRYGKRSVTPTAVKHCLDKMPCGVCVWQDGGRVLFSNICMNRLCVAVTGSPLLSGNLFYDAISDGTVTADGKRWRFTCRDIILDGERLHEMIASDITAEYAKTQILRRDKAELSRLNRELKAYTSSIDDTVRRREILQAKVNIHDEMNRLMLLTAAEGENSAAPDDIFSLWEQNALLLCMQAGDTADIKSASRVEKLAESIGIRLIWQENLPAELTDKQKSLFFSAAQEAIANAAKHARAKRMNIIFTQTDAYISCAFINDGEIPEGEVRFAGGLHNLFVLAKKQGALISADNKEKFTLTVRFPKNQPDG